MILAHRTARVLALIASSMLGKEAVGGEYTLQPGDVIEVSIAGAPDFRQKYPVDPSGMISIPVIGEVQLGGKSTSEARREIRTKFEAKAIPQRTLDGREVTIFVKPSDVSVTLAEYRPVYITGDVAKPGEQPFRPGLSIRQAISVAGGYELIGGEKNVLISLDIKAEHESILVELAREKARARRLEAELNAKRGQAAPDVPAAVPGRSGPSIEELENNQLTMRVSDFNKEQEYLKRSITQAGIQIQALESQKEKEEEGVQADSEEMDKLRDAYQKGTVALLRYTEMRRTVLLSSTRALQTRVQLEQLRKEREERMRALEKLGDQYRLDVTRDLQESNVRRSILESRLAAVAKKLLFAQASRSPVGPGKAGNVSFELYREGEGIVPASANTDLLPGDVVTVSVDLSSLLATPK